MHNFKDWNGEVQLAALAMNYVADSTDICRPRLNYFVISFSRTLTNCFKDVLVEELVQ